MLCTAERRNSSPSRRYKPPKFASQIRVALSNIAWNTGASSPGELAMTPNTSDVAACCSRASASSRVRALTFCCRSARVELARRVAVGELLRFGLVGLRCCGFAGFRLTVPRRLTEPSRARGTFNLPHREGRCAAQQNWPHMTAQVKTGSALVEHKISASPPKPDICDAHRRSPEDPAQRRAPPGWKFAHQSSPGRPRSRLLLIARAVQK